jgi:hypothetical protein
MSLGPDADGVKHSEGPQVLRFERRFRNGALCRLKVDLAEVRTNTFRPHFVWSGRACKRRELVQWIVGVFQVVSTRTGVSMGYCFPWKNGESETWLFDPGQRPRRLARQSEPCRNPFAAFVIALDAKVAIESYGRA